MFPTCAAAKAWWYDTMPGRNDHAVYVRIPEGKPISSADYWHGSEISGSDARKNKEVTL